MLVGWRWGCVLPKLGFMVWATIHPDLPGKVPVYACCGLMTTCYFWCPFHFQKRPSLDRTSYAYSVSSEMRLQGKLGAALRKAGQRVWTRVSLGIPPPASTGPWYEQASEAGRVADAVTPSSGQELLCKHVHWVLSLASPEGENQGDVYRHRQEAIIGIGSCVTEKEKPVESGWCNSVWV